MRFCNFLVADKKILLINMHNIKEGQDFKSINKMSQTLFSSLSNFYLFPSHIQTGIFREWLASRGQCTSPLEKDNIPLWVHFVQQRAWGCLEEILDYSPEENLIDYRDNLGRGFVHLCVYGNAPNKTVAKGIALLGSGWMDKDHFGSDPFDIFPPPDVAQKLAWRYWVEQNNTKKINTFFHEKAAVARKNNEEEIARIWDFWTTKPKE